MDRHLAALMELQRGISFAYNTSRVGTTTRVLIDDWKDGVYVCRSEAESPEVDGEILVRGDGSLTGSFAQVRITQADEYDLKGVII